MYKIVGIKRSQETFFDKLSKKFIGISLILPRFENNAEEKQSAMILFNKILYHIKSY